MLGELLQQPAGPGPVVARESVMIDTSYRGWKTDATRRCKEALRRTEPTRRVNDHDELFLKELIELHPEANQKIGCGIDYFKVERNQYGGRNFWLVREDGTETDFSYISCISAGSAMADFAKACRTAVADDVIAFRDAAFAGKDYLTCPVIGERIFVDTAHVDHEHPGFKAIVDAFALTLECPTREVEETRDGDVVTRFKRPEVADAFRAFHSERAALRVVSKYANLSVLRKRRQA